MTSQRGRQGSTIQETYAHRLAQRRASADIADIARAATYGLVGTVLVDIDESLPGSIDENGAVTFDDADDAVNYGVGDEIARRVWLNGGKCSPSAETTFPATAPSPRSFATPAESTRSPADSRQRPGQVAC